MHPSGDEDGSVCLALGRRACRETLARSPVLSPQHDDMLSDATYGALLARERFDPAKGVPFVVYGMQRARWEILDGLRKRGPLSRSDYRTFGFRAENLPPSRQEPIRIDEWEAKRADGTHAPDWQALIPPQRSATEAAEARVIVLPLLCLLEQDSPRHAYILRQYYLCDRTFSDIAKELGVTESRVCQLSGEALGKLRRLM